MVNGFWISYLWFFILSAILSTILAGMNPLACYQWKKLVQDVVRQRRTMSIPLYNQKNRLYFGEITVGSTSEQTIKVMFDSCSKRLIVMSPKNIEQKKPGSFEYFDPSDTTTYEKTISYFHQEMGDGSTYEGPLISTVVKIGGPMSQVKAPVEIVLANRVRETAGIPVPGIFGLAFTSQYQSIISKSALTTKFSVYYRRETTEGEHPDSGEIFIGGYNPNYMDSEFFPTVKVVKKKDDDRHWFFFYMNCIRVRSETISLTKRDKDGRTRDVSLLASLDTGSSFIALPPEIYEKLMSHILDGQTAEQPLRDGWFLCEKLKSDLPQIEFNVMNDVILKIGPENYIVTYNYLGYECLCRLLLKSVTSNEIGLGAGFFHRYYTMFDYGKKEIKFAEAKQPMVMDAHKQPGKAGKECRRNLAHKQSDIEKLLRNFNRSLQV